ncbi:hypothetical protein P8C59_007621 [Phyllachora maydis]|uniref:Uncharacterized protein n=1 Tax=Phyllachora maydis TaxID=1825666 RepID=A0AAD9IAP5_9PEZI|nr:hypothetical protein P8C59_007621 [Phyllachora maydis]
MPLALVPTPAKLAKITPAIRRVAACKAKQRKSAKAYAIRSKHTAGGNAGRYTTNSGLIADKDDNNAYNGVYVPPAKAEEEEEGGSSNDNSINSSTSDSADKGKGSSARKYGKGALYYKDILPSRYFKVLIAFKPTSAVYVISKGPINEDKELSYSKI